MDSIREKRVAVLYARQDSVYKGIEFCDVWDAERDARGYPGGLPVVAHPPCRTWGRLAKRARAPQSEQELARHAVRIVRENGGVLEHPAYSKLWKDQGLPLPGRGRDARGGWTLPITQHWWGHKAEKATWLYIVGRDPQSCPPIPMRLGGSTHVVATSCARNRALQSVRRPEITKAEREHTPLALALWLCELAAGCGNSGPCAVAAGGLLL